MLSTYFNKFLCHSISIYVIPMEMGIHLIFLILHPWIPAFAGMTEGGVSFKLWFCGFTLSTFRYTRYMKYNFILAFVFVFFFLNSTLNATRYLLFCLLNSAFFFPNSTLYAVRSTLSFILAPEF